MFDKALSVHLVGAEEQNETSQSKGERLGNNLDLHHALNTMDACMAHEVIVNSRHPLNSPNWLHREFFVPDCNIPSLYTL
jgi:hypothetical protein